jgi:xanthosine utilization system XapX-like protein
MAAVAMVVVPFIAFLANSHLRHWIIEVVTAACVLGGMIAAPVLALIGWVGLILPEQVPLHRASTTLFAVAVVWVAAALIGAHWHNTSQRRGR